MLKSKINCVGPWKLSSKYLNNFCELFTLSGWDCSLQSNENLNQATFKARGEIFTIKLWPWKLSSKYLNNFCELFTLSDWDCSLQSNENLNQATLRQGVRSLQSNYGQKKGTHLIVNGQANTSQYSRKVHILNYINDRLLTI